MWCFARVLVLLLMALRTAACAAAQARRFKLRFARYGYGLVDSQYGSGWYAALICISFRYLKRCRWVSAMPLGCGADVDSHNPTHCQHVLST